jgi:hypothetical protein
LLKDHHEVHFWMHVQRTVVASDRQAFLTVKCLYMAFEYRILLYRISYFIPTPLLVNTFQVYVCRPNLTFFIDLNDLSLKYVSRFIVFLGVSSCNQIL